MFTIFKIAPKENEQLRVRIASSAKSSIHLEGHDFILQLDEQIRLSRSHNKIPQHLI